MQHPGTHVRGLWRPVRLCLRNFKLKILPGSRCGAVSPLYLRCGCWSALIPSRAEHCCQTCVLTTTAKGGGEGGVTRGRRDTGQTCGSRRDISSGLTVTRAGQTTRSASEENEPMVDFRRIRPLALTDSRGREACGSVSEENGTIMAVVEGVFTAWAPTRGRESLFLGGRGRIWWMHSALPCPGGTDGRRNPSRSQARDISGPVMLPTAVGFTLDQSEAGSWPNLQGSDRESLG